MAQVPAEIVVSRVSSYPDRKNRHTMYRAQVRYRYRIAGRSFESEEVGGATSSSSDRADAEQQLAPYPLGARVTAHVDPADPSSAALRVGMDWWFLAIFYLAGVVWAALFVLAGRLAYPPKP